MKNYLSLIFLILCISLFPSQTTFAFNESETNQAGKLGLDRPGREVPDEDESLPDRDDDIPSDQLFYRDADGDGYGDPNVSRTTVFRNYVPNNLDCNDWDASINPDTVWYRDADGDGFGDVAITKTRCLRPLGYVSNSDDCNDDQADVHPSTRWYADGDGDGFGDPNDFRLSCVQPAGYVLNSSDACPSTYGQNGGCPRVDQTSTPTELSNQNYVHTMTYQKPFALGDQGQAAPEDMLEAVTYYDGLGRPMQQIAIGQSPTGKDIITHHEYDAHGREAKAFLPYVPADTMANGLYRDNDPASRTHDFYLSHYPEDLLAQSPNPYTEQVFERSPLSRVLEQAAPGRLWAANPGGTGEHTVKFEYDTNASGEVRLYQVTFSVDEEPGLELEGWYAPAQLLKSVIKDENWTPVDGKDHTSEEFKDKQDRLVLKRTYEDQEPHDTYYVYDIYGNLSFVLPPKAEATVAEPDATILAELCYQYVYDAKNRLVEKKIPGKDWEYIVYDKLNRPVLTQDALLRAQNRWLFTKYDAFGRVVYSGIFLHDQTGRAYWQDVAEQVAAQYESYLPTAVTRAGTPVHYSSQAFPQDFYQILTINYYDGYGFDRAGLEDPVSVYGTATTQNVKGLATGVKVRVLDTDDWITTVTYYDQKARPISVATVNPFLGTQDVIQSQLDFVGKVLESTSIHARNGQQDLTVVDVFTYDHAGRVVSQFQTVNDQPQEMLFTNTYDALGQLIQKEVGHSAQEPLQTVDYRYNIRGWLKSINDVDQLGDDLFSFGLSYADPSDADKALYNGNISETRWKTVNDNNKTRRYLYDYDALNRLITGTYRKEGDSWPSRLRTGDIKYDKNGNIEQLLRNDLTHQIDFLTYQYDAGNKLLAVTDESEDSAGFRDGNLAGWDYTYDANGNMKTDANKGIVGIEYNHLNLPTLVDFGQNREIAYVYDAAGTKLRKRVRDGEINIETDYAGNFVYENNRFQFGHHPEGYLESRSDGGFSYVYQYKDHLGNVRLSYTEPENQPLLWNDFENGTDGWSGANVSHENGRLKVIVKNQWSGANTPVEQTVYPGEIVRIRLDIELGDVEMVRVNVSERDANDQHIRWYVPAVIDTSGVFEVEYTVSLGERLLLSIDIPETIASESTFTIEQVSMTRTELVVVEEKNYYPFGLQHEGYNEIRTGRVHPYGFGGKEEQDEFGIAWHDFGARNYDAALGRWMNVDPLAEEMRRHSPYNYAFDNPVFFTDPDGMAPESCCDSERLKQAIISLAMGLQRLVNNETFGRAERELKKGGAIPVENNVDIDEEGRHESLVAVEEIGEASVEAVKGGAQLTAEVADYAGDGIAILGAYTGSSPLVAIGEGLSYGALVINIVVDISDDRPIEEMLVDYGVPLLLDLKANQTKKALQKVAGPKSVERGETLNGELIIDAENVYLKKVVFPIVRDSIRNRIDLNE